ncbi:MAG TPA: TIGR00266 family protein [Polyangiaceae bacterium]|jgi:uncharacterized protein (TIGR00266 family)|nr:TIGR00266 family protein [Polyangiaceae bacterium]
MQFQIEHGPAFAWLRVQLGAGERITAEAGAMVRQSPTLEMDTRLNAPRSTGVFGKIWGFMVAMARKMFGGETPFLNDFHGATGGEVVLAPSLSGSVVHRRLGGGSTMFVQTGSYLASSGNVDMRIRWGGLRSFFGGEGLVLLECFGDGDLFMNSYGGVTEVPIDGAFVVDTGHIVAFEGSLDFKVRSIGGLKSFLFSGEGLVCEFQGRGTVFIQSRNMDSLVSWLSPMLGS